MEGSAREGSAERVSLARSHKSELKVRRLGWYWPVAIIVAVLYGSCIPFDFKPEAFTARGGFGVPAIGFHLPIANPFEDIITNLLVYMPIGLTLVLYGRCRRFGRLSCLVVAVLIGMGVSLLAETLQTSFASRVASWFDVLINSAGTAVGAVLGATLYGPWVSAVRRLRTRLADRRQGRFAVFATLASLLMFGLFFCRLAPFDFITDSDGLRDSFLRTVWTISDKCKAPSGAPPYAAVVDQLALAGWFAGLGYVLALSGREAGRRRIPATASAIQQGCIIVVVTELMQLFTRSHVFDTATIVIGSLAVVFGAWLAIFVVDAHTRLTWKDHPDGLGETFAAAVPTPLLLTLIVFQVGVLFASSINPHLLSLGGINLSQVEWVPFEALWRRPMLNAAGDILSTLIVYGVLATTLVIVLHRARIARVRLITAVAVTAIALVVEGLHTATTIHAADITGPVLALFASAGPVGERLGSAFIQLPSAA